MWSCQKVYLLTGILMIAVVVHQTRNLQFLTWYTTSRGYYFKNFCLEETHMIDVMINMFSEIADLFIHLGVDKLIDKIAKKPHI